MAMIHNHDAIQHTTACSGREEPFKANGEQKMLEHGLELPKGVIFMADISKSVQLLRVVCISEY
jgi:hypothetical protein